MNTFATFTEQEITPLKEKIRELTREIHRTKEALFYYTLEADFLSLQTCIDRYHYYEAEILRIKLRINELQRSFVADQFKKRFNNQ